MAAAANPVSYVPLSCAIEVKCVETGAYHNAEIKTVLNGQALVHYEAGWRSDEWVVPARLRKVAPRFDPTKYTPQVGDKVEVQAKTQDSEPYSWWLATIRTARQDLFMINYASFGEEHNEILEKNHIRPLNTNPPLSADDLQRHEIKLPQELWDQVKLDDYATLSNAGATAITFDAQQRSLIVLGNAASLTKADLIAGVLFKHQQDLLKLKQKTLKHHHDLTVLEQRLKDGIVIEFVADKNLLGLVIGANGKNVDRVQHSIRDIVNIRVNSKTGQVTIVGKTQEAVNAARAQLEYVEEKYSIPRVHFGRVVGKKFQNIRDLEKKSNCRIKPWDERDRKFGGAGSRVRPPKAKKSPYSSATSGPGGDGKNQKGGDDDDDDLTDDITGDMEDLSLVGLKETVSMARLLLDAHFRSITELQAAVDEEKALAVQVADLALDAGPLDEAGQQGAGGVVRGGRRRGGEGKNYRGRGATNAGAGRGGAATAAATQGNGNADQQHQNQNQRGGGSGGRGGRGGGRGGSGSGGRGGGNAGKQQQMQPQQTNGQGNGQQKQQNKNADHKHQQNTNASIAQGQGQSQGQNQQKQKQKNQNKGGGGGNKQNNDQKQGAAPTPAGNAGTATVAAVPVQTQQLVSSPVASAPAPVAAAAAAPAVAPAVAAPAS